MPNDYQWTMTGQAQASHSAFIPSQEINGAMGGGVYCEELMEGWGCGFKARSSMSRKINLFSEGTQKRQTRADE